MFLKDFAGASADRREQIADRGHLTPSRKQLAEGTILAPRHP